MQNISKKPIVAIIMLIIAIIVGGWFWYIFAQKRQEQMERRRAETAFVNDSRTNLLAAYAGCEIKTFNLAVVMPDKNNPEMSVGIDNVNKSWKADSQRNNLTYDDVVAYMMKNCPPSNDLVSDANTESFDRHVRWMQTLDKAAYEKEQKSWDERIELEKNIHDYKLKFISKELSVFQNE